MDNSECRCHQDSENIDKEPPVDENNQLTDNLQCLLDVAKRHAELYKTLSERKCQECHIGCHENVNGQTADPKCTVCRYLHDECAKFLEPLRNRLASSVSTALAAYGAVEQLNRLYQNCLARQCVLEDDNQADGDFQKERIGRENVNGVELEPDILALLDSSQETGERNLKENSADEILNRFSENDFNDHRQTQAISPSSYSHGKGKVSKWTKVKAAFKWERADVVTVADATKEYEHFGVRRMSDNREIVRYLRVPVVSCGGSSPDSMVSSSSGPLLSETGDTPGTISSASSTDDLYTGATSKTQNLTPCVGQHVLSTGEVHVNLPKCASSGSEKRLRRISKVYSDIEPLREEDSNKSDPIGTRKVRIPPKPLNLDLKQDLSDLDGSSLSVHALKSPHRVNSTSNNRARKISSPGNSSVPSSPSRNSDFFAEFESEDISSGEFSEPTTPNGNTIQRTQEDINRRYQILQKKLDKEFAAKQREWEKQKTNPNSCRAITIKTPPKSEEQSPNPILGTNFCADFLEENLTPDFKKKLRKWRVKKQTTSTDGRLSPSCIISQFSWAPVSPNKDKSTDSKVKIDWNSWKTAYGVEQKNLPEEFQRKLDQWDKIKRNGGSSNDSFKRCGKSSSESGSKKSTDDDRAAQCNAKEKRIALDKWKAHEKEKLEKLSKLKTAAAEVEVKTSVGVIKFEGISRKFTRKLYEWEKARGIGPESSTFALLHPGYCPIDVDQITRDSCKNLEHSPTISRSLSLDSVAPNPMVCSNSQRASSLSLNNINELRDIESIPTSDELNGDGLKQILQPEPEAVMVEVEDDIIETARQLISSHSLVEKEIPVYKYEQVSCNDYCNAKRVQSFESCTNLAPLLSVLKHTDEVLGKLKKSSPDIIEHVEIRHCVETLSYIRLIYPHYADNLVKPNVLNAIIDVQADLERITNLSQRSPLDEACCQEIMEERNCEYNEEFMGLREALELLRSGINGGSSRYHLDIVPDINVTSEDGLDSSVYAPTTMEATTDDFTCAEQVPNQTSLADGVSVGGHSAVAVGSKKKLRLRKVGSRQNSKTESSDSSDTESGGVVDTPRRLKRKTFRTKPRSFEEPEISQKIDSEPVSNGVYGLKVKPGEPIEMYEKAPPPVNLKTVDTGNENRLPSMMTKLPEDVVDFNENANVFVKTKRKVFTTIKALSTSNSIAVVECDIEASPQSELELLTVLEEEQETMGRLDFCNSVTWPPLRKSFSAGDFRRSFNGPSESCIYISAEHLPRQSHNVPVPLALDSLQIIEKSIPKQSDRSLVTLPTQKSENKPHFFKKNTEKSNSGATLRKIGSKIVKSFQSTHREVPAEEVICEEKPNEHAHRLQNAKEHLLHTIYGGSGGSCSSREVRRVSCSDINGPTDKMRSEKQKPTFEDKGNLLKSVSADAFNPLAPSDTPPVGPDARVVTRSGKLSSKLGFANLASKFLRPKGKKVSDKSTSCVHNTTGPKEGALSTLCRQSLFAESATAPIAVKETPNGCVETVHKSHSTPIAVIITEEPPEVTADDNGPEHHNSRLLNKSQSDQLVINRNKSLF